MTTSRPKRMGTALAAVLLAAALGPLAARAQDEQTVRDKPRAETRSVRRETARDLFNITPEQEKKLQELREARTKDRQAFRERMTKMRGEMRDLMKDPKANAAKIDELIDQRARLRAEREKLAIRTRGEREKIFTPEQLDKMKKYRGAFMGRPGAEAAAMRGFGRPWMGRFMGERAAWGWRMRAAAWRWRWGGPWMLRHRPFFWRGW